MRTGVRRALRVVMLIASFAVSFGASLDAQGAARADSARRAGEPGDSLRAQRLADVRVSVTRTDASAQRAPWAVGLQEKVAIARGQATLGIDEVLNNIPGVYVSNRYNYSLDQRLSIRGAGSRANFGIRGVKVLLDGVPQSLPDGQTQLTNVDLAAVSRVEVLRGSASSLFGNGSGGVIAFTTDLSAPDPLGQTVRLTSGAFGTRKLQLRTSGRSGPAVGAVSLSHTAVTGFRQYSRAELTQLSSAMDYALGGATTLALRASYTRMPQALNPGALTSAEYAKNRDSAAATSVARGVNKALAQSQFAVRLYHGASGGSDWSALAYVVRRFVDNPIATPPPGTAGAAVGTYTQLNRWVTGVRLDGTRPLCACTPTARTPRLSGGLDVQRSLDVRRNLRATGGHPVTPTDTLFLDQGESVVSLGPFASVQWSPVAALTLSAGARWDDLTFRVSDHFLRDGLDNSGVRDMTALSGHVGASYVVAEAFTPYLNYSTAFETPTTTELNAKPDGSGGFNADLGPQRIHTVEAGARGTVGGRIGYTVSAFRTLADDAIIQYLENNGRAYFRNAGRTRNDGLEVGLEARAARWLDVNVAWTEARYRFVRYRVQNRTVTDTLDGKSLPGVPDRFVRLGLRARWRAAHVDLDHTWSAALFADDKNTIRIDDWGRGSLTLRASWVGTLGDRRFQPFVGVNNVLDQAYVGAVTLNGTGGRVFEPSPLRHYYFGMELGWGLVK